MSSSDRTNWELSQSLSSIDGLGIRCAAVLPANETDEWYRLVTGNQGGSIVEYTMPSGAIQVLDQNQHNHAVTAILSSSRATDCFYVTACKDGVIRVFHGVTHESIIQWPAHEKAATSLAFADAKERYIVTGSWDGTAKVWDLLPIKIQNVTESSSSSSTTTKAMELPKLIATLPNHENSVCVTSLYSDGDAGDASDGDSLQIVTGSAGIAQGNMIRDHSVRLWSINVKTGATTLLYTVANDHEGPIRDIRTTRYAPGSTMLATCSNDGTVRVRDPLTGTTLSTLVFSYEDHPPMLLSLTYVEGGHHNPNEDDIDGPKDTVTGTMVAAAEAGHVVFWNHAAGNIEPPQVIRHADCVWTVQSLPNGDVSTCGQDGSVRIFTRSEARMAPVTERQEFTDSVNTALQALQNGPTSEEVTKLHPWHLSFEKRGTSEGQVHLFNKNNVAIAAQWSMDSQTWIEVGQVTGPAGPNGGKSTIDGVSYDHVLPIELEQTSGQVSTLQIGYNNGENPYTAGQRFIDRHMLPQSYLSQIADYITQRVGKQPTVLGMATSANAASVPPTGGAFTGAPMTHYEYLPGKVYKTFDLVDKTAVATFDKMKIKIQEFGGHDQDIVNIGALMTTLQTRNRYHASKVTDMELSSLSNLLTTFTAAQSFPTLDLARLTVLHPDASTNERSKYWYSIIQSAVILCQTDVAVLVDESGGGPAVTAVPMLTLRLFSNALKGGPGSRTAVLEQLNDVLNCATIHATSSNKNIRLSVATLIYNVCWSIPQNNAINLDAFVPSIVGVIAEVLNAKVPYESEALIRTMVAMGSLAMASSVANDILNANYLASKVEPLASSHGVVAKTVAKEVYSVLS